MNGNGQQPPSQLFDAQNRPVSTDDPLPYALGDMAVTIVGDPKQKYQDAFQRHIMPEIIGHPSGTVDLPPGHPQNPSELPQQVMASAVPATLAQVRSLFGWARSLWEVSWQETSMSVAQLSQVMSELQLRIEGIERALNTLLEGGYTVPSMPSPAQTGVYQSAQGGSPVRVWPQPDGTYPPFPVPADGVFALGMHRAEVKQGDVMTRTDGDGLSLTRGDQTTPIPKVELG